MTVYTQDGFSAAFGTTDGTPPNGTLDPLTWTQTAGVWTTSAGVAQVTSVADSIAQLDSTFADVTVAVTLTTLSSATAGLVFRFVDTTHYWRFTYTSAGAWVLANANGGAPSTIASGTVAGAAANDQLKIIANGSTITAYVKNNLLTTQTNSNQSTATKHGLYANSNTTVRFDNFSVSNPEVVMNRTQTQTPTETRSVTAARTTLSVTQTQTPTIPRNNTRAQSVTVTQTQTPTITELVGHVTSPTGDEANPTYVIKVVGMEGDSPSTLTLAEPDTITKTLNQPDEFTFHFAKNAYAISDIPVIGTSGTGAREVQIYRNGDLQAWGPVVGLRGAGNDGAVQCDGAGVDWYLNRRFVDGTITNRITNPDFESGTSNWTASNTTFTTDTGNFETGTQSAKLVTAVGGADSQIHQSVTIGANGLGTLMTASAWFFIDSFTAPAFSWLGLYLEAGPLGVAQVNNWYPIDNATPRQDWTKASTTIWIPPNQAWTVQLRLYGPQGTIHWDDVKLVAMDSVGTEQITGSVNTPTDIANIVQLLVAHEQNPSYGKSHLNIGTTTPLTGTKMVKHYQFVDHVQFDQAMREFIERHDGIDYAIDYTPTTRTFHSFAGKRGTDRTGTMTLRYDVANPSTSNCTDYRFSEDGGACVTRQVILGEDNGPDREQGEAADATNVGGVILQDVRQAPQNSKTASLQPLADERISRFKTVPLNIEMDVRGSTGFVPSIKTGDLVTVVVNDGYVQVSGAYRVMKLHLNCVTNILTVTTTLDTLS